MYVVKPLFLFLYVQPFLQKVTLSFVRSFDISPRVSAVSPPGLVRAQVVNRFRLPVGLRVNPCQCWFVYDHSRARREFHGWRQVMRAHLPRGEVPALRPLPSSACPPQHSQSPALHRCVALRSRRRVRPVCSSDFRHQAAGAAIKAGRP